MENSRHDDECIERAWMTYSDAADGGVAFRAEAEMAAWPAHLRERWQTLMKMDAFFRTKAGTGVLRGVCPTCERTTSGGDASGGLVGSGQGTLLYPDAVVDPPVPEDEA